jgi:hypothetical protein
MHDNKTNYPYEPEFSFKQVIADRMADLRFILRYKIPLILFIIIGGAVGAATAWWWKPSYTARLTFIIDDSKAGGGSGGGLSALAGEFGFNLNGIGGATGVLAGDNVQALLKSTKLIKATLVSAYDNQQTLADRYAAVNKLDKKWLKYSPNGEVVRFPLNGKGNTRLQDSLLHEMTILILSGNFGVAKTDKKLDFFEINTTMKDEKLALLFCNRILMQATDFFITTKTKRLRSNVMRLQHRADSISVLLNRKTYTASSANQSLLNLNPAYTSANANVEVRERDKIVLTTIFTETVKNLESSKALLAQETPTVQVVDEPELPLKKNRLKYSVAILAGMVVAGMLFCMYVLLFMLKKHKGTAIEQQKL